MVFNDYFFRFYEDIFFETLVSQNIREVWVLGDFFDRRKFINFKILSAVRKRFLHPLENLGVKMRVLLGNHDVYHKNTNEINAVQEILGGWPNVEVFNDPEEFSCGDKTILFMPWITQDNYDYCMNMIQVSNAQVLAGHLQLTGFMMYAGHTCDSGMDPSTFSKFDLTISGHFHIKNSIGDIHYLGAPYPMTFGDMGSAKGFHILDTKDLSLEFIQNPYEMFHRVIYDDRGRTLDAVLGTLTPVNKFENTYIKVVVTNKSNPYYFDRFMDHLYSVNPVEIKVIEDFNYEVGEETIEGAEDTLTVLNKYVDGLTCFDGNKSHLKDFVKSIYLEAMQLES